MANPKLKTPPVGRDPLAGLFPNQRPAGVDDLAGARTIAVTLIDANPFQPRRTFDQAAQDDLAASIRQHGVLQALAVRKVGDRYQIIAGERRLRAAKQASLDTVPCIIHQVDHDEMETLALLENIQRADLDPLEEAHAYQRLMARFGLSHRDLAARVHKHHTYIAQRLRLIADPEVEEAVRSGALGPTVAQELVRAEDAEQRRQVLDRVRQGERLKVKDVKPARSRASGVAPAPSPARSAPGAPPAPARQDGTAPPTDLPVSVVNNSPPRPETEGVPLPPGAGEAATAAPHMDEERITLDSLAIMRLRARGNSVPRSDVILALWADLDLLEGRERRGTDDDAR